MDFITINKQPICFRAFTNQEMDKLIIYLNNLSEESKKRFGPHNFDKDSIINLMKQAGTYQLFIAKAEHKSSVVAYTIIKKGWLDFEFPRLSSYGLKAEDSDYTIAPSVADDWQGKGLGTSFLNYLIKYAQLNLRAKRIILWGGVQSNNIKAVRLYQKTGFRTLGEFEHHGINLDMILDI